MKKLFLLLAVTTLLFTACDKKKSNNGDENNNTTVVESGDFSNLQTHDLFRCITNDGKQLFVAYYGTNPEYSSFSIPAGLDGNITVDEALFVNAYNKGNYCIGTDDDDIPEGFVVGTEYKFTLRGEQLVMTTNQQFYDKVAYQDEYVFDKYEVSNIFDISELGYKSWFDQKTHVSVRFERDFTTIRGVFWNEYEYLFTITPKEGDVYHLTITNVNDHTSDGMYEATIEKDVQCVEQDITMKLENDTLSMEIPQNIGRYAEKGAYHFICDKE